MDYDYEPEARMKSPEPGLRAAMSEVGIQVDRLTKSVFAMAEALDPVLLPSAPDRDEPSMGRPGTNESHAPLVADAYRMVQSLRSVEERLTSLRVRVNL